MVRKRGKSRRSFKIKRFKRYKVKVDPRAINLSFKQRLDYQAEQLSIWLTILDNLEKRIIELCDAQGIPREELVNYIAYAKKQFERIDNFSGLTLLNELNIKITEAIIRGLRETKAIEIIPILYDLKEELDYYREYGEWKKIPLSLVLASKPIIPRLNNWNYLFSSEPIKPDLKNLDFIFSSEPIKPDLKNLDYVLSSEPIKPNLNNLDFIPSTRSIRPDLKNLDFIPSTRSIKPNLNNLDFIPSTKSTKPDLNNVNFITITEPITEGLPINNLFLLVEKE